MREAWVAEHESAKDTKTSFPRIKSALQFLSGRGSVKNGSAHTSPNRNPVSDLDPAGPAHARQSVTLAGIGTQLVSCNSAPQLDGMNMSSRQPTGRPVSRARSMLATDLTGVNCLPNAAPPYREEPPTLGGRPTLPGSPVLSARTPTPPLTPPRTQARSQAPTPGRIQHTRSATPTDPTVTPPSHNVSRPRPQGSKVFRDGLRAAIAAPLERHLDPRLSQSGHNTLRDGELPDSHSQPASPVSAPREGQILWKGTSCTTLEKSQTTLLLDWDDTLLPTSHISAFLNKVQVEVCQPEDEHEPRSLTDSTEARMKKALHLFEDTVLEFLEQCLHCAGTIIIVTNGTNQWIEMSCRYIPRVAALLSSKDIEYVSARTCSGSPDPSQWKMDTFRRLVANTCGNLISIGDAFYERYAAHSCAAAVPASRATPTALDLSPTGVSAETCPSPERGEAMQRCRPRRIKTIKMIDRPSILQMRRQLSTLANNMQQLAEMDADIDADLELPVIETGGWDALAIPAVPEGERDDDGPTETARGEIPKSAVRMVGFIPQTYQQMHQYAAISWQ